MPQPRVCQRAACDELIRMTRGLTGHHARAGICRVLCDAFLEIGQVRSARGQTSAPGAVRLWRGCVQRWIVEYPPDYECTAFDCRTSRDAVARGRTGTRDASCGCRAVYDERDDHRCGRHSEIAK